MIRTLETAKESVAYVSSVFAEVDRITVELEIRIASLVKMQKEMEKMRNTCKKALLKNLELRVDRVGLSSRAINILKFNGVTTLRDLVSLDGVEVRGFPHMGKASFKEIVDMLDSYGLYLGLLHNQSKNAKKSTKKTKTK